MTAENPGRSGPNRRGADCFNEAAADDRGKPPTSCITRPSAACFNEAAADDRGKPTSPSRQPRSPSPLQ